MPVLTKAQILKAKDCETRVVDVPEWGGQVILKALDAGTVMELTDQAGGDPQQAGMAMLALSMVDEKGEPLFSMDDLDGLRKKSYSVILRLLNEVQDLNGTAPESLEEAGNGSEPSQDDSSSSD